ncbi:MAG: hypothetical protein PHE25_02885 [Candidatus Gracilibacteria bacterium]|nr:hypothetical protein [Candidatus Gracilibacteria bacterium]
MKILSNLRNYIAKNKKKIFYFSLFVVIFFSLNDFAFAAEPATKEDAVLKVVKGILGMASQLIGILTLLVGVFLRPEWTSGSIIGLDTQLKTMWILISNIVYFIFAGIFITIAFMNIIGKAENYELKKAIPKFIVGVIIVPFSWFFVQFILSLSSLLTTAVLSLPFDSFQDLNLKSKNIEMCLNGTQINLSKTGSNIISCKDDKPKETQTIGEFIKKNDNGGLYQILVLYSYGVMTLDDKGKIFTGETKDIKDIWSLSFKAIFDVIFVLVYCLLIVALFLAFITRGFALWFYVMFSPTFGLLYYFGKSHEGMGEGALKKFNLKEFIGLAFVPVYVSAALSFGLLFLSVAGQGFSNQSNKIVTFKDNSIVVGDYTFTANGTKTNSEKLGSFFAGFKGSVGATVLELLGLVVMWMAVMAALKQSEITKNVTEPIDQFGDQIGKLLAKAPTYAPILPGGLSVAGLPAAGTAATSYYQGNAQSKMTNFLKEKGLFDNEDVDRDQKSQIILGKYVKDSPEWNKNALEHLKSYKSSRDISDNDASRNLLIKLANELQIKDAKASTPEEVKKTIADMSKASNTLARQAGMQKEMTEGQVDNNFFTGGKSSGSETPSSNLKSTIKAPDKLGDKNTFNVYSYNEKGEIKSGEKPVEIIVEKGKVKSSEDNIKKALKSYFDEEEGKNALKIMGIDDEEIKRIMAIFKKS